MNILIIGNPNSIWIKNYIKYVLLNHKYNISVLYYDKLEPEFLQFYNSNNIRILGLPHNDKLSRFHMKIMPFIRKVLLLDARIRGTYDYIHVHYVTYNSLKFAFAAKSSKSKIIATPWGSDLIRADDTELEKRLPLLQKTDAITIQSQKLFDKMQMAYGNKLDEKYRYNLKMGLDIFEDIDAVRKKYSISDCKSHFGFYKDKIIIAVGYNGSAGQQHFEVLKVINALTQNISEKIEVVMHISYALPSNEYKERLHEEASHLRCKVHILEKFMYNEEIAMLRYATDVFVHAQITDEYSASVQEYIYAGSVLINPTWIDYQEFIDNGIHYVSYKDFDNLQKKLYELLSSGVSRNYFYSEKLKRLSSWDNYLQAWNTIYKDKD